MTNNTDLTPTEKRRRYPHYIGAPGKMKQSMGRWGTLGTPTQQLIRQIKTNFGIEPQPSPKDLYSIHYIFKPSGQNYIFAYAAIHNLPNVAEGFTVPYIYNLIMIEPYNGNYEFFAEVVNRLIRGVDRFYGMQTHVETKAKKINLDFYLKFGFSPFVGLDNKDFALSEDEVLLRLENRL